MRCSVIHCRRPSALAYQSLNCLVVFSAVGGDFLDRQNRIVED